jgi:putative membrane protein
MMDVLIELKPMGMLATIVYSLIGMGLFALAFFVVQKITPFSLRKEIEEDQNTALAIIIGSIFIALAIIIQAAIRG